MLLGVAIFAFLAGALLVLGLATPGARQSVISARLAQIAPPEAKLDEAPRRGHDLRQRLARALESGTSQGATQSMRALLERAGNPIGLGAGEFIGLRVLSAAVFLALAPPAFRLLGTTLPMKIAVVALDLIIGLTVPEAWLQGRIRERQAQIRKSLPDTLDLLVVSVEAGVGFDGAVAQVAEKQSGPLADELRRALQEMRLGRTRAEALKEMAGRVDVPEVTRFVAAITQADRLGAGVANALRMQSETARTQRMQRVREAAASLPTRMLFPLVFFLFPALFVVLLGPGLINLFKMLGPH